MESWVLYFPSLQHCFKVQGFTNTLLGAIFGKRFNSSFFINKLLMQYICKELSKPMNFFWENLQRHLFLYRNKNLKISQSFLFESAKLHALHAHVPACLAWLHALVPKCPACLRAHVPTCLVCLRAHLPTCLACLCAQCLCALCA